MHPSMYLDSVRHIKTSSTLSRCSTAVSSSLFATEIPDPLFARMVRFSQAQTGPGDPLFTPVHLFRDSRIPPPSPPAISSLKFCVVMPQKYLKLVKVHSYIMSDHRGPPSFAYNNNYAFCSWLHRCLPTPKPTLRV